jgi:membrane protease YdiL (CAAX protease family)
MYGNSSDKSSNEWLVLIAIIALVLAVILAIWHAYVGSAGQATGIAAAVLVVIALVLLLIWWFGRNRCASNMMGMGY